MATYAQRFASEGRERSSRVRSKMVQVLGGRYRGRALEAPAGISTRPTSSRAREGIFSALQSRQVVQDSMVLDLFAGSGAMAFEALSRGASFAVLIDRDPRALSCIARNARSLDVQGAVHTLKMSLVGPLEAISTRIAQATASPFDLVFLDPPYRKAAQMGGLCRGLAEAGALAPDITIVLEASSRDSPQLGPPFALGPHYRYGDTLVTFWNLNPQEPPP